MSHLQSILQPPLPHPQLCWKIGNIGMSQSKTACLDVCLSVCLSVCLPVYLSICLSFWLSDCISICFGVCQTLSPYLSIGISVHSTVCDYLSALVCLTVCLSVWLTAIGQGNILHNEVKRNKPQPVGLHNAREGVYLLHVGGCGSLEGHINSTLSPSHVS